MKFKNIVKLMIATIIVCIAVCACQETHPVSDPRNNQIVSTTGSIGSTTSSIVEPVITQTTTTIPGESNFAEKLEDDDFSVSDRKNTITLGALYEEVKTVEQNYKLEEITFVGEITSEGEKFDFRVYQLVFSDFDLFISVRTTNKETAYLYDPYLMEESTELFESFHVTQIRLKTSAFTTNRGIAVGMKSEDVISEYGEVAISDDIDENFLSYITGDRLIDFITDENQMIQFIDFKVESKSSATDIS